MKRHLNWIILLLLVPVIFVTASAGARWLSGIVAQNPSNVAAEFGILTLLAVACIAPIIVLVFAVRGMVRSSRPPKTTDGAVERP